MTYKNILITIIITLLGLFSGYFGWIFQFIFVGLVFFLVPLITLNLNDKNKILLLNLPFIIIYGASALYNLLYFNEIFVIPIVLIAITSTLLLLFFRNTLARFSFISNTIYVLIVFLLGYFIYPNWLNYSIGSNEIEIITSFPKIEINNINNTNFSFDESTVKVIDVWSSNCGICIKKFPDFEDLKNQYKNNANVSFYTLNLPLKRDSLPIVKNYVSNYSFVSLFAKDYESLKKLNIKSVPKFLVLNKNNEIIYKGSLNEKWYHFYNNIHLIIKENL